MLARIKALSNRPRTTAIKATGLFRRSLQDSRDLITRLHRHGLIACGSRSPEPGAPYTYVITPGFLMQFGLETLRDLPDVKRLKMSGC